MGKKHLLAGNTPKKCGPGLPSLAHLVAKVSKISLTGVSTLMGCSTFHCPKTEFLNFVPAECFVESIHFSVLGVFVQLNGLGRDVPATLTILLGCGRGCCGGDEDRPGRDVTEGSPLAAMWCFRMRPGATGSMALVVMLVTHKPRRMGSFVPAQRWFL